MTSFDQRKVEASLGVQAMRVDPPRDFWGFEIVGPDRILYLSVDIGLMQVSLEMFGRQGGQPMVNLWLDYCHAVRVAKCAGQPVVEIVQTIHCHDCGATRDRRYCLEVKPEIRFWNEIGPVD